MIRRHAGAGARPLPELAAGIIHECRCAPSEHDRQLEIAFIDEIAMGEQRVGITRSCSIARNMDRHRKNIFTATRQQQAYDRAAASLLALLEHERAGIPVPKELKAATMESAKQLLVFAGNLRRHDEVDDDIEGEQAPAH